MSNTSTGITAETINRDRAEALKAYDQVSTQNAMALHGTLTALTLHSVALLLVDIRDQQEAQTEHLQVIRSQLMNGGP